MTEKRYNISTMSPERKRKAMAYFQEYDPIFAQLIADMRVMGMLGEGSAVMINHATAMNIKHHAEGNHHLIVPVNEPETDVSVEEAVAEAEIETRSVANFTDHTRRMAA